MQVEFHNCLQALSGSAAGLSTPPGPFSPAPRATPPPPGDCSQPAQPSPLHRMGAAASSATQCAAGRTLFSTEGIYAKALKEIEHSEFKELPSCSSRAAPQVHCNEQVAPSGQCTNSVPLQEGRLAGSEVPQQQVWRDDAVSPACSVAAGREPAAQMRGLVRLLAALLKRQVLTARLVLGCAEQLLGFASSAGGGACALALCELLTCTGALVSQ